MLFTLLVFRYFVIPNTCKLVNHPVTLSAFFFIVSSIHLTSRFLPSSRFGSRNETEHGKFFQAIWKSLVCRAAAYFQKPSQLHERRVSFTKCILKSCGISTIDGILIPGSLSNRDSTLFLSPHLGILITISARSDQQFEEELFNKCKQTEGDLKATSGVLLHVCGGRY